MIFESFDKRFENKTDFAPPIRSFLFWRDAVSPGSSPSASDDFDLLPCDISPDFLYRGAYRGNNVPGALSTWFYFPLLAYAISTSPFGGH